MGPIAPGGLGLLGSHSRRILLKCDSNIATFIHSHGNTLYAERKAMEKRNWFSTSGLTSPLQVIDGTPMDAMLPDMETEDASVVIVTPTIAETESDEE